MEKIVIPMKKLNPDRLAAVLAKAEEVAKGRDIVADDAALSTFGEVDPVEWPVEVAEGLTEKSGS